MGLIDFPNPIAMFESAKNAGVERETAQAFVSVALSDYITGLWSQGTSKVISWLGEAQTAKDMATACYLSLTSKQQLKWLVLTVPKDLLNAENLARFQTEYTEGK